MGGESRGKIEEWEEMVQGKRRRGGGAEQGRSEKKGKKGGGGKEGSRAGGNEVGEVVRASREGMKGILAAIPFGSVTSLDCRYCVKLWVMTH